MRFYIADRTDGTISLWTIFDENTPEFHLALRGDQSDFTGIFTEISAQEMQAFGALDRKYRSAWRFNKVQRLAQLDPAEKAKIDAAPKVQSVEDRLAALELAVKGKP